MYIEYEKYLRLKTLWNPMELQCTLIVKREYFESATTYTHSVNWPNYWESLTLRL